MPIFSKDIKDIINQTVDETISKIEDKLIKTDFKFECGQKVKDLVTGFEGIIIGRTQWLHNCNTYGVRPITLKDGKPQDMISFDEPQLEFVGDTELKSKRDTGGPERPII